MNHARLPLSACPPEVPDSEGLHVLSRRGEVLLALRGPDCAHLIATEDRRQLEELLGLLREASSAAFGDAP